MTDKQDANKKLCYHCEHAPVTLFKIKLDGDEDWRLVCRACWETFDKNKVYYRFGGTTYNKA